MKSNFNYVNRIKKNILIVDDEEINREILGAILEDNFNVFYAANGKEALEIIMKEEYYISAVLLDLNMPVMSGVEFLKIIKENKKYSMIPVLVLTAEKNAEIESLNMGAHDFIAKPYVNEVVLARTNKAIELVEDRNIIKASERDILTQAYNSNIFVEYATEMERYTKNKYDMICVNISDFHLLKEVYGKALSDNILRSIADALRKYSGKNNGIVGRDFGDYFTIFIKHIENYNELIKSVKNDMNREFPFLHIRIKYGIYECHDDETMQVRLDRARFVCDSLRTNNHTDFDVFNEKLRQDVIYRESLIHDFQTAIDEKQFIVVLQPKYDIRGDKYLLKGAEALVRWRHPEYGMIPPMMFIELFEDNGLIRVLDYYVYNETIKKIKYIKDKYNVIIPTSVNVSRIDLYDNDLEEKLIKPLEENGLKRSDIHLEITESAYTSDTDWMLNKISELSKLGFIIEMDDFGTGYSSLNMLTKMPFNYLKLDRSFIKDITKDEKNYKMVELLINMSRFLDSLVVAEGVEEKEQVEVLKKLGCDLIQGYYFSKPVELEEFEKLIGKEF